MYTNVSLEIPEHQKFTDGKKSNPIARYISGTMFILRMEINTFHVAEEAMYDIKKVVPMKLLNVINDKKEVILQTKKLSGSR